MKIKYSNLTTNDRILSWIDNNKNNQNHIDSENRHLLDWVCAGYRGKTQAKLDLIETLIKKGVTTENITQHSFDYIAESFLVHNRNTNKLALEKILSDEEKLTNFKKNIRFSSIFFKSYKDDYNFQLKKKIIFDNLAEHTVFELVIFLCLISNSNPIKSNYCENLMFILDSNHNILLSSMKIQSKKQMLLDSGILHIENSETMLDVLLKTTLRNDSNNEILKAIETIEIFKSLQSKLLNENSIKKNIIKI